MKKFILLTTLALPLSLFAQTYSFEQGANGYYDGSTWTNVEMYSGNSLTSGTAKITNLTVSGTTLPSNAFQAVTYDAATVCSADLTAFPSSADYKISWKYFLDAAGANQKSGVLLRAQDAASGWGAARQGYYFMFQSTGTSGSIRVRVIKFTASTSQPSGAMVDQTVAIPDFTTGPIYLRASAQGSTSVSLTAEYSTDNTIWTTITSVTDLTDTYPVGKTQIVWGYGTFSGITLGYFDDITYARTTTHLDAKTMDDVKIGVDANRKLIFSGNTSTYSTLNLYSFEGVLIMSMDLQNGKNLSDVTLKSGAYIAVLKNNTNMISKKILVR